MDNNPLEINGKGEKIKSKVSDDSTIWYPSFPHHIGFNIAHLW